MTSITRTPLTFSPAYNPIVFQLSGDSSDLIFYKIAITEESSQATIYTGNIFPTPRTPDVATINLSKILSSLVRSDVDNAAVILTGKTRNLIGYNLTGTEYGVTTGGTIDQLSTGTTSNTFNVFEAGLDILNFTNNFTNTSHVCQSADTSIYANFLTLQPDLKQVTPYSFEQLYFIQNDFVTTGVNGIINVNNHKFVFPYTGSAVTILTPAVPEVRAVAYIGITATAPAGDNLGIYVNTGSTNMLLGAFTALTPTLPFGVAAGLGSNMVTNPYGFSISFLSNGLIEVLAPVGYGSAANSFSLTGSLVTSASTYTGLPFSTANFTGFNLYSGASYSGVSTLGVHDPYYGTISLGTYFASGDSITGVINGIVTAVNENVFGYSASATSAYSFLVYSRPNVNINGINCIFNINSNFTVLAPFVSASTGSTLVVHHNIIPSSITGFTGGVGGTPAETGLELEKMLRIQTSPKKLTAAGVTGLTINNSYQVFIEDMNGNRLTEIRNYKIKDVECNVEYVNICWLNSLGGIDAYQFINPQFTVNATKQSITRYNENTEHLQPYINNGVYNTGTEVYKSVNETRFKVYTQPLSDNASDWLTELVNSRQIWAELSNGQLLPLTLTNTNYTVQHQKYIKEFNQFNFEFSLDNNYMPMLSGDVSLIINQ